MTTNTDDGFVIHTVSRTEIRLLIRYRACVWTRYRTVRTTASDWSIIESKNKSEFGEFSRLSDNTPNIRLAVSERQMIVALKMVCIIVIYCAGQPAVLRYIAPGAAGGLARLKATARRTKTGIPMSKPVRFESAHPRRIRRLDGTQACFVHWNLSNKLFTHTQSSSVASSCQK